MITIHEENHLYGMRKISKADINSGVFRTSQEFMNDISSGFYCDSDCSAYWACIHSGDVYRGDRVSFRWDYDIEKIEWSDKPDWATHVYWYSK